MDITKFGAEKSFGMVLDIQKCPWSPGGAVFRIVVEVRAVTTESFRRIQKIEKESALDICQPDICRRTFTTSYYKKHSGSRGRARRALTKRVMYNNSFDRLNNYRKRGGQKKSHSDNSNPLVSTLFVTKVTNPKI